MFMHSFQEFLYSGANENKYVTDVTLDFYGQDNIWVLDWLEGGVYEGLVEVKDQGLLPDVRPSLRSKKIGFISILAGLTVVNCSLGLVLQSYSIYWLRSCGSALHFFA